MRIDPESGEDINDPVHLMDRYRSRGYGFYSQVMSQYEGLMNLPVMIRVLSDGSLPRLY